MAIGPIHLLRQATTEQRRTLLAAALGWMLDAFDAMLYALVLAHVMRDLGMSKATAGLLSLNRLHQQFLATRSPFRQLDEHDRDQHQHNSHRLKWAQ